MRQSEHCTDSESTPCRDVALRVRVSAEFREMPGLRLSLAQASRLFSLERAHCSQVLDSLVESGVLFSDRGLFQTAATGRHRV